MDKLGYCLRFVGKKCLKNRKANYSGLKKDTTNITPKNQAEKKLLWKTGEEKDKPNNKIDF